MKTTIVKNSLSLVEKSVFGHNKSEKAKIVYDRKRSVSGTYNQSLNLYMHQINHDEDFKQKTKRRLQASLDSVSSTDTINNQVFSRETLPFEQQNSSVNTSNNITLSHDAISIEIMSSYNSNQNYELYGCSTNGYNCSRIRGMEVSRF